LSRTNSTYQASPQNFFPFSYGKTIGESAPDDFLYVKENHLGNVLTVVSDRKLGVDNVNNTTGVAPADGLVDFYLADVRSATDYYSGGFAMPRRSFNPTEYRYGNNTQEKDNEIFNGAYTAQFWEYDSRLLRRWNTDPKPMAGESPYACFSDNPILNVDPNGDFRTKFGANIYKFLHGGTVKLDTYGKHKGEYFVERNITVAGQKGGGNMLSEAIIMPETHYDWGVVKKLNAFDESLVGHSDPSGTGGEYSGKKGFDELGDDLGKGSTYVKAGSAIVVGAGVVTAQPEIVAGGVAGYEFGSAMGQVSTGVKVISDIDKGNVGNAVTRVAGEIAGSAASRAIGGTEGVNEVNKFVTKAVTDFSIDKIKDNGIKGDKMEK